MAWEGEELGTLGLMRGGCPESRGPDRQLAREDL